KAAATCSLVCARDGMSACPARGEANAHPSTGTPFCRRARPCPSRLLMRAWRAESRGVEVRGFAPGRGAASLAGGMPSQAWRQPELFQQPPREFWAERLLATLVDARHGPPFLPLAERAVAACPNDAGVLLLAAASAVLDQRPKRALSLLQRLGPDADRPAAPLLQALALHQSEQRAAARALLERHGLTTWPALLNVFPGARARLPWLLARPVATLGRGAARPQGGSVKRARAPATLAPAPRVSRARPNTPLAHPPPAASPQPRPAMAAPAVIPSLPRIA